MSKLTLFVLSSLISSGAYAQCCPNECKPQVKYRTKVIEKPVVKVVQTEVLKVVDRPVPVKVRELVYRVVRKKNRLNVLAGTGPTKLNVSSSEARLERGTIAGVQYQRSLGLSVNAGVLVLSNQSVLGSLGFDF